MGEYRKFCKISTSIERIEQESEKWFAVKQDKRRNIAECKEDKLYVNIGEGYRYAVLYYTDKVEVKPLNKSDCLFTIDNFKKLTELRMFGEKSECYMIRANNEWRGRIRCDTSYDGNTSYEIFDELHKVWNKVDVSHNIRNFILENGEYSDTSRDNKDLFIRVRNYFELGEELKFIDWRFVEFELMEMKKDKGGRA